MINSLDLLIFDCDGTLVDSEPMQNLGTSTLLAEEGLPQYTPDIIAARFTGSRFGAMLKTISAETEHVFPEGMSERYVRRVTELTPTHLKKIPYIEDFVAEAAKHMKIAVASNGQRDSVVLSLRHNGLKSFFPDENIFTAVQVQNAKPAPDLFLFTAEKMGVAPERCLVIEDSIPGITGAKAAGMRVFGFTGAHHNPAGGEDSLRRAGADAVFDAFIHIKSALFG